MRLLRVIFGPESFKERHMFHRKWLYHKDQEPVLVESEDQEKALGKSWVDHPVAEVAEEAPKVEEKDEHKAKKKGHK